MSDEAYAVVVNGRTYVEMYEAQKLVRQSRRSALEEAAKVAEAFPARTHGNLATAPYAAAEQASEEIAAAIRVLKVSP